MKKCMEFRIKWIKGLTGFSGFVSELEGCNGEGEGEPDTLCAKIEKALAGCDYKCPGECVTRFM